MDKRAWQATVHRVSRIRTSLCHRRDLSLWPRKEVMKSQGVGECSRSLKQEEKCMGGGQVPHLQGRKKTSFRSWGGKEVIRVFWSSQVMLVVKNLLLNVGDVKRHGFDPWVGKIPRRRAWQPTPVFFAWRIPWTEEPGGLQSLGSHKVLHD